MSTTQSHIIKGFNCHRWYIFVLYSLGNRVTEERKREDKFEIAFYIEEIIFAFDQNTGESPGAPRTTNSSRTIDSSAEAALEGRGGGAL